MFGKPRFNVDSLQLMYADVERAKQWWVATFECKAGTPPADWDEPLPSNVAITLPGSPVPTIVLCDREEVMQAQQSWQNEHEVIFTGNVKKAHEYLSGRGAAPGPLQNSGGKEYFEIKDPEGNEIEICSS